MGNRSCSTEDEEPKLKKADQEFISAYRLPATLQSNSEKEVGFALQVNFNVIRASMSFKPLEDDPRKYELRFEVNTLTECTVEVLHYVREELDAMDQFIRQGLLRFTSIAEEQTSESFEFQPGNKINLPERAILVDIEDYENQRELYQIRRNYPIVITLVRSRQSNSDSATMTLCLNFTKLADGQGFTHSIASQKLHLNGQSWTLFEIYGQKSDLVEDDKNCVVCLTEEKNTAMQPCMHMCLCISCAKIMRGQLTAKCPICRAPGSSFAQIKIE